MIIQLCVFIIKSYNRFMIFSKIQDQQKLLKKSLIHNIL